MASLPALVKRFMKSAFRVDAQKYLHCWQQSSFVERSPPPNGQQIIHTPWGIGSTRYTSACSVMMRHDGRVQSRKCVRGLLCAEAMARDDVDHVHWFYFYSSRWVNETEIFLEMWLPTLACGVILLGACEDESRIGTNDWTVNVTFPLKKKSKKKKKNLHKLLLNRCQFSPGLLL